MKRRAFILTEILTGMMLQVMFAVVLCSAFYLILNFSTSAQQGFAANDKGQMVIAYFDSRIRGAGLGLWGCHGSADVRASLTNIPALQDTNLCLPVAIVSSPDSKGKINVSHDKKTKVYSGNVVTLLYARKDTKNDKLILLTSKDQKPQDVKFPSYVTPSSNNFSLIGNNTVTSYKSSNFPEGTNFADIRHYTVIERSGVPLYTFLEGTNVVLQAPSETGLNPVTVYPMSEMLNLECQKLYVRKDDNGYNFVYQELNDSGNWRQAFYHTKDILDLYMTLDTKPDIPIFELRVLVSEGINEQGTTSKPKDWPGRWTTEFSSYKVHVSKATWKLYNLATQFH